MKALTTFKTYWLNNWPYISTCIEAALFVFGLVAFINEEYAHAAAIFGLLAYVKRA